MSLSGSCIISATSQTNRELSSETRPCHASLLSTFLDPIRLDASVVIHQQSISINLQKNFKLIYHKTLILRAGLFALVAQCYPQELGKLSQSQESLMAISTAAESAIRLWDLGSAAPISDRVINRLWPRVAKSILQQPRVAQSSPE